MKEKRTSKKERGGEFQESRILARAKISRFFDGKTKRRKKKIFPQKDAESNEGEGRELVLRMISKKVPWIDIRQFRACFD